MTHRDFIDRAIIIGLGVWAIGILVAIAVSVVQRNWTAVAALSAVPIGLAIGYLITRPRRVST